MRRRRLEVAVLVAALGLTGCPDAREVSREPPTSAQPASTTVPGTTAQATPAIGAGTATVTQAVVLEPESGSAEDAALAMNAGREEPLDGAEQRDDDVAGRSPKICAARARWVGLERCTLGGHVYAVGQIKGVRDVGLARASAADRARRALEAGKPAGKLFGSEVVGFVRCGRTSYALARMPAEGAPSGKACDAALVEAHVAPAEGCPDFTTSVVRRDGDRVLAVGVARVRNAALAEAAAINRARAEVARFYATELTSESGEAHSHAEGNGYTELGRRKAVCQGDTYVELTVRNLGGG